MPINNVATEYTFSMVFISSPENFAITQKYASFACDIIMEPPPMANTQSNLPFSLFNPRAGNNGSTIDAAVIMATVDEPWAVFNTDVSKNGKNIPMLPKASEWLKWSPIFEAAKIAPNAPPMPMITNIPPAFSVDSCKILLISIFFQDRLQLNASSTPINSAITGSPKENKKFGHP